MRGGFRRFFSDEDNSDDDSSINRLKAALMFVVVCDKHHCLSDSTSDDVTGRLAGRGLRQIDET